MSVRDTEGKKVYSITDAGRALLNERRQSEEEFSGPPWMRRRGRPHFSPELQALKTEAMEVVRLLTIAGRMSFEDAEQLAVSPGNGFKMKKLFPCPYRKATIEESSRCCKAKNQREDGMTRSYCMSVE